MQSYNFENAQKFTVHDFECTLTPSLSGVRILVLSTYCANDVVFLRQDVLGAKNRFVCLEDPEIIMYYYPEEGSFYLNTHCFIVPIVVLLIKEFYFDGDKAKVIARTRTEQTKLVPIELLN